MYLLFESCHPKPTKINVPFKLARRPHTIISGENTLDERMQELEGCLTVQHYPEPVINAAIENARNMSVETVRTVTPKEEETIITFVSTFNPRNPEIFSKIKSNLFQLESDSRTLGVLDKFKIIKSKRQPANLKKLLSKAWSVTDSRNLQNL